MRRRNCGILARPLEHEAAVGFGELPRNKQFFVLAVLHLGIFGSMLASSERAAYSTLVEISLAAGGVALVVVICEGVLKWL